jgi:sugar/nucleoside kinase (ribokinase family)
MPHILCAGIAVLDEVFRVREFPLPDTKVEASEFITVGGGCAANAAVAIARLGGKVTFAAPLGGPPGQDAIGDRLVQGLAEEGVDCSGCVRVGGARTPVSAIFLNARGDRTIATYRDQRLNAVVPGDPDCLVAAVDAVLVDNRFPGFVTPICRAARRRGLPVVIDADKPTVETDPLFAMGTHVVFSGECLRRTAGTEDLAAGLARIAQITDVSCGQQRALAGAVARGWRSAKWRCFR